MVGGLDVIDTRPALDDDTRCLVPKDLPPFGGS